jgi:phosphoribosylaminoimidazole (AIR) synthetase
MGMGFTIIVAAEHLDQTLGILEKYSKVSCKQVGMIEKGTGVYVPTLSLEF